MAKLKPACRKGWLLLRSDWFWLSRLMPVWLAIRKTGWKCELEEQEHAGRYREWIGMLPGAVHCVLLLMLDLFFAT